MISETPTLSSTTRHTSTKKRSSCYVGAFVMYSPSGADGSANTKQGCNRSCDSAVHDARIVARREVWPPDAKEESGVHRDSGNDAGAGDWRKHGRVFNPRSLAASQIAGSESRSTRAGPCGRQSGIGEHLGILRIRHLQQKPRVLRRDGLQPYGRIRCRAEWG